MTDRKQALVRELEARGLLDLVDRAKKGEFSDFASPHAFPVMELVKELEAAGCPDLGARAREGDFDHNE